MLLKSHALDVSVRGGIAWLIGLRRAVADRPPGGERCTKIHGPHDPEAVLQSVAVRSLARDERSGDLQGARPEGKHVLHATHHVAGYDLHHPAGEHNTTHAAAGAHDEVDRYREY